MPEFKYAQGRISESLQFISQEIKEFEQDYILKTKEDYLRDRKLQKLMDRTVENILTALIEVCGTVVTQEGIAVESYAQILKECANLFSFSPQEQEELSKLAFQRNRLAHRYLNFRWEAIRMFIRSKPLILRLLEKILEREKKKEPKI
ncbi:MAG: hypothetical protein B6D55_01600 [Candidatus Omnitrophica bacterium 4484_70.2]|nr:MAG: hypothetical protein B6D55_01600 [Candidatus Omnitrophica bacterium 4484_70.2]